MSFFDKIGKTITDTTHTVVEKTKSSTDTIRLNGMINDEERNINAAYLNIGKKYAELHEKDAEPEFQEYLNAIAASQQKIEEYRDQIRKNKHLLICQGCGAEIPETVLYCTKCGAENPVGKRLAEERAAKEAAERAAREAAAQQAAQQAAAQQAAAQANFNQPAAGVELCQNCGKPRTPGAMFCTGCGTRFVPVQTEASSNPIPAPAVVSSTPAPAEEPPVPAADPVIPVPAPVEEPPVPAADPVIPAPAPVEESPVPAADPVIPAPAPVEESPVPAADPVIPAPAPVEDPPVPAADLVIPTPAPAAETTPVPEPAAVVSSRMCPTCGKEVSAQYKFCTNCGAKLDEFAAPAAEPAANPEKTCPVCGKVVPAQNKFCTSCGTRVKD